MTRRMVASPPEGILGSLSRPTRLEKSMVAISSALTAERASNARSAEMTVSADISGSWSDGTGQRPDAKLVRHAVEAIGIHTHPTDLVQRLLSGDGTKPNMVGELIHVGVVSVPSEMVDDQEAVQSAVRRARVGVRRRFPAQIAKRGQSVSFAVAARVQRIEETRRPGGIYRPAPCGELVGEGR